MDESQKETKPTAAQDAAVGGCGLVLALFWVAIIAGCFGVFSCDNRMKISRNEKHRDDLMVAVNENGGEFKILWTYPTYGGKNHEFRGHSVVAEGVKTGKRIEASPHPLLPVPGEVWEVTVGGEMKSSDYPKYKFVRKIR